jgi:hypothetical protein
MLGILIELPENIGGNNKRGIAIYNIRQTFLSADTSNKMT